MEKKMKLYSQKAILIATYIGGPLAAGILVRKNYINLEKKQLGLKALIIGVISTFVVFFGVFSLPENLIEKIPSPFIPLIYVGITYFIVNKIQGQELSDHKRDGGLHYHIWRATIISLLCCIVILAAIFIYYYYL